MAWLRRYVVAEDSMRPALQPGDGLLAVPLRRPHRAARTGDVVVVRRPGPGPDLWLVKRVAGVGGDVVEAGGRRWDVPDEHLFLLSDDTVVTDADSRRYGPLPTRGASRVVLVIPAAGGRPRRPAPLPAARPERR